MSQFCINEGCLKIPSFNLPNNKIRLDYIVMNIKKKI